MIIFTVRLAPGSDHQGILSEEIVVETHAQIMTTDEARALGFSGFPDRSDLRLIAVTQGDAGWIEKALERAPQVVGYERSEVDM